MPYEPLLASVLSALVGKSSHICPLNACELRDNLGFPSGKGERATYYHCKQHCGESVHGEGAVGLANVRVLQLAVAVLALKTSQKTPRLPLVGCRAWFGAEDHEEWWMA